MPIHELLARIRWDPEFGAAAEDGTMHTVPYHRVRSVWRNGELIWHRHAPPA